VSANGIAGTIWAGRKGNRYLVIGIDRKYYKAHRIIWKLVTGAEPPAFIDHIDGDNLNNRWENLRAATNGQNIQNAKLRKDNKSGHKGVCWDKSHKAWSVHVAVNGKQKKFGRYKDLTAAISVANRVRLELHGSFARVR
jgi:hypothetical protein